jgi:hypothetical protein
MNDVEVNSFLPLFVDFLLCFHPEFFDLFQRFAFVSGRNPSTTRNAMAQKNANNQNV